MVLERYRTGWDAFLLPLARGMRVIGLTPNMLTVVSLLFAVAAAVAFALATADRVILLLVGALCVGANAILDGLDGRLARLMNSESKRGDYLDHIVDRYADLSILLGLTLSPLGNETWGLFAIVGTLLTSYMGTQAQALGLGRNYAGLLGRADRLVLLIAVPTLWWGATWLGLAWPWAMTPVTLMLAYFAIVGNLTAVQRFWSGWRQLGA